MTGGYEATDVVNQALDAIGWPEQIGDMQEGSDAAQVALRAYRQCRQQLLRAAHWDFARKQAPLTLLADASGNTANVGTVVPVPWLYEYAYPTDCLKMRFIPQNYANPSTQIPAGNIQIPQTPIVDGLGPYPPGLRMLPARFILSTDVNYPPPPGSDLTGVVGVSPQGRTVVLTNVRYAQGVYTADMLYPTVWDSLFRAALVAYIGAEIAVGLWAKRDPKQTIGITTRDRLMAIVGDKLQMARATNGNEGNANADVAVDWMRNRRTGGPYWGAWGGMGGWGVDTGGIGVLGYGWDTLTVSGGAAF